jgi:Prokaryotic membrane lipoprotein lipid attachment site
MKRLILGAVMVAALAGCQSMSALQMGMSFETARETLGEPTQAHTTASGPRLIYSFAPGGASVRVIDFDKQGRLIRDYEAMHLVVFTRIKVGQQKWEVERELGPAFWYSRYRVSSNLSGVYRFDEGSSKRCFYVEYDSADRVVATAATYAANARDLLPGEREC